MCSLQILQLINSGQKLTGIIVFKLGESLRVSKTQTLPLQYKTLNECKGLGCGVVKQLFSVGKQHMNKTSFSTKQVT